MEFKNNQADEGSRFCSLIHFTQGGIAMRKYVLMGMGLLLILMCQLLYAQETIQIIVGQQRRVAVPSGAQVNIGDPTIATARALPGQRQIIITGRSKGATSLTFVSPGGQVLEKVIEVLQRDPKAVVKEIKDAFGAIEGINFQVIGSMVLAKGSLFTIAEKAKLEKIISIYPQVINLTEDLTEKRMVSIAINIIEVSRTGRTDFNNNELPSAHAEVGPFGGETGPPKGNPLNHIAVWNWGLEVDKLLDRVAYWITTGKGKIVANPTIAVTDGDEAIFMSGGEIPFEYSTRDGLAIEWKEYGIIINIKPTILGTGNVMLDLESEVSSIDRSYQSSTGLPAIASRKANSISIVNMGETVALAGIYQTTQTRSIRRVPILGYILPFLFASINNITETKEIIVLVTPKAPPEIKKNDYPMIQKSK